MISPAEAARIERILADLEAAFGEATAEAFLAGPDGDPAAIDIDPVFAKDLATVLRELAEDLGLERVDPEDIRKALVKGSAREIGQDIWVLRPLDRHGVEYGVIALHAPPEGPAGILGAYGGCDLAVDPAWRRRGIGKALVVECALQDGWIPVWSLDTQSYTPEGAAVHAAGFAEIERLRELVRACDAGVSAEP